MEGLTGIFVDLDGRVRAFELNDLTHEFIVADTHLQVPSMTGSNMSSPCLVMRTMIMIMAQATYQLVHGCAMHVLGNHHYRKTTESVPSTQAIPKPAHGRLLVFRGSVPSPWLLQEGPWHGWGKDMGRRDGKSDQAARGGREATHSRATGDARTRAGDLVHIAIVRLLLVVSEDVGHLHYGSSSKSLLLRSLRPQTRPTIGPKGGVPNRFSLK